MSPDIVRSMSSAASGPDPSLEARTGPTARAIDAALKRLCTRGAAPYWVRQKCPALLDLAGVTDRLISIKRPSREEATAALVDYLRQIVTRIDEEEDRIVLEVVLGLKEEYLVHRRAPERQALAGKLCRGAQDPLSGNTIRQRELPRALEALYALILEDEGLSSAPPGA
jgi:hypothetical protein